MMSNLWPISFSSLMETAAEEKGLGRGRKELRQQKAEQDEQCGPAPHDGMTKEHNYPRGGRARRIKPQRRFGLLPRAVFLAYS